MEVESTVKFLWDLAKELSPDSHTKKLLKSYYMNTCRTIASRELQVPKEKFAPTQMCPRCSSFWVQSEFALKLRPQQIARTTKAKKLIARLDESKATQKKLLTKKQRKRAKWLKKRVSNSMEIRCDFCQQTTQIPLEKPKKNRKQQANTEHNHATVAVETPSSARKPKKKHKIKDKTAGLKLIVAPKEEVPDKQTQPQTTRKKGPGAGVKPLAASAAAPKGPTKATTIPSNVSKPLKAKKKKKKKPLQTTPIAPKIQSKTQQKNTLLQLAALLRSQPAKGEVNTTQNRLESLLK